MTSFFFFPLPRRGYLSQSLHLAVLQVVQQQPELTRLALLMGSGCLPRSVRSAAS